MKEDEQVITYGDGRWAEEDKSGIRARKRKKATSPRGKKDG